MARWLTIWPVPMKAAVEGIDAEVIDMRWLSPLDTATVVKSVQRTGALLVVEEGPGRGGWEAR